MKVLAIVPAYNEQDNILKVIKDLEVNCPERNFRKREYTTY